MTRGLRRRRLSFSWWQQLLLTLLPLVLVIWFFGRPSSSLYRKPQTTHIQVRKVVAVASVIG